MRLRTDFFISYRETNANGNENTEYSGGRVARELLYKPLKKRGYTVYYDPKCKSPGEYSERLQKAVVESKIFLWVLTNDSLICKADTKTKYNDWYYAEILWALKYKKVIIPIIAPDFKWPTQSEFNRNINRAFRVLKETEDLLASDIVILEDAKKLYKLENHMECVNIDDDFSINEVLKLIKKKIRHKPIRRKKIKIAVLSFIFLVLLIIGEYNIREKVNKDLNKFQIWNGKRVIDGGWNSVKGKGTKEAPYEIENANQLAWLSYYTGVSTCNGMYFKLINDITLNDYQVNSFNLGSQKIIKVSEKSALIDVDGLNEWIPIGSEENPFEGNFDGNGHSIKGLYINSKEDFQGLFGYCGKKSRIENVNLCFANLKTSGSYIGAIAGYNMGVINKCNAYYIRMYGAPFSGGIAGKGNIISNSYSNSWIDADKDGYCGGIVGQCNNLINSISSIVCYTYKENKKVGALAGCILGEAYNCVALYNSYVDVKSQVQTYVKNNDNSNIPVLGLYGEYMKNNKNIIPIVTSYSDMIRKKQYEKKVTFGKATVKMLNDNLSNINKYEESDIYKMLLEYDILLEKWICWENPKGVWNEIKSVPSLKSTYKAYIN